MKLKFKTFLTNYQRILRRGRQYREQSVHCVRPHFKQIITTTELRRTQLTDGVNYTVTVRHVSMAMWLSTVKAAVPGQQQ